MIRFHPRVSQKRRIYCIKLDLLMIMGAEKTVFSKIIHDKIRSFSYYCLKKCKYSFTEPNSFWL